MSFRAFLAGIHCGSAGLSRSFLLFFQLPFLPRVIRPKLTRAKPIPSFHLFSLVDCVTARLFKSSSSKGCCVCTTAGIFSRSSLSECSRLLQKRSWVQQPADPDTARGAADWGEPPPNGHIQWNMLTGLALTALLSLQEEERQTVFEVCVILIINME